MSEKMANLFFSYKCSYKEVLTKPPIFNNAVYLISEHLLLYISRTTCTAHQNLESCIINSTFTCSFTTADLILLQHYAR